MMMGGSLVKWGNPREPVLARAGHRGRGGGGCHLPAPSCCLPAPPARSGRSVPGPRVSAAGLRLRAGVESVATLLSPAPCQSCPRGAGEHITSLLASQVTSQTSAVSLQPSHIITSSPDPHKCTQFDMNKWKQNTLVSECRVTRVVTTPEPKQNSQSPLPSWPASLRMLMPNTVASPLPTVMSPGVSSVVSSPATSIVPTITSTIQVSIGGMMAAVSSRLGMRHKCAALLLSASGPALEWGGGVTTCPSQLTQAAPAQSCTGFLISGKCFK